MTFSQLRIRDLIDVPPVKTVIRLDEACRQLEETARSFIFTAEVADHFTVLADALLRDSGKGYFLQGDFGSGKSHFLAALSGLLRGASAAASLASTHERAAAFYKSGRGLLDVEISLVNFRAGTSLERIIASAIEQRLAQEGVHISISPLSIFFERFKTIVQEPAIAKTFHGAFPRAHADVDRWIAQNPHQAYAEAVRFLASQNISLPEALVEERSGIFDRALDAAREAGYDGIVLIIDELSEFFRSKPEATSRNEDARTLQFLGEYAAGAPLWIIAAVQESIEKTGDIAQATFRKIKDRFPVKLQLSTLHIRDLIGQRLIIKRPGADERIYEIYKKYRAHFSTFTIGWDDFRAIYPVHPTTLSLLEGLGDLFSQHRGIVDFVCTRLAGDPDRHLTGIMERSATELLAPDSIYEHFAPRLSEFSAFHIFPRHIVPHLDTVIEEVIDDQEDRGLARRLIRILVLYAIHPAAATPNVRELTELTACMLAAHDPDVNVEFVAKAILDPVVMHSRFLTKEPGPADAPFDAAYKVVTRDDHGKSLEGRLRRAAAEIDREDSRLIMQPLSELPNSYSWPGAEILAGPVQRSALWRQSARKALMVLVAPGARSAARDAVRNAVNSDAADFAVAIAFGATAFDAPWCAVWRMASPDNNDRASLTNYCAARAIRSELHASNPAEAPLIALLDERLARLADDAQRTVLKLLYSGAFENYPIQIEEPALQMRRIDRILETAAEHLCEERYPRFRDIASRLIPPSLRLYQRLLDDLIRPGTLSFTEARTRGLTPIIDSIAVSLGLIEVRAGSYRLNPGVHDCAFLAYFFEHISQTAPTPIDSLLHSLRHGPYGAPVDMVEFVLLSLAHAGLVALMAKGRTQPLERLHAGSLGQIDAVAPGELIGKADRDLLLSECAFLLPQSGHESFGLRQQRDAWQAAIKLKRTIETICGLGQRQVSAARLYSAFASLDFDVLSNKMAAWMQCAEEIKPSYGAREGLERFCRTWRRLDCDYEDLDYLRKANKFFSQSSEHFVFVAHYLRNQSVVQAVARDESLERSYDEIQALLEDPMTGVIPDEGQALSRGFDVFRSAYAQIYGAAHETYYKAMARPPLSAHAARVAMLLRRLAAVPALDRPAGLSALLAHIDAPQKQSCNRTIHEELLRAPMCGCGFTFGDAPGDAPPRDPSGQLEEALFSYRDILSGSRVTEAITARSYALRDISPDCAANLSRLSKILGESDGPDARTLIDLLDDRTIAEIARGLSGAAKLTQRSLRDLNQKLAGRRLTASF